MALSLLVIATAKAKVGDLQILRTLVIGDAEDYRICRYYRSGNQNVIWEAHPSDVG